MEGTNKIRILLIEDDYALRMMFSKAFESGGFVVAGEAENGKAGLELYQSLTPDIVICDIEMPIINGIQTLKAIRAVNSKACVIMLTSVSHPEVWEECLLFGARHYINKETPHTLISSMVRESWAEHLRMVG